YAVLSDTKLHFVLIDFVNGLYEIQARQYDGFTGLASPVVRHSSTSDRWLVARSAALLVNQDFGFNGTVPAGRITGDRVELHLKGASLGVPLDRWVRKGEVFAVTQTVQVGPQQRAFRMPFTLLQVIDAPRDGVCSCHVLYRKTDPRAGPLPAGPGV